MSDLSNIIIHPASVTGTDPENRVLSVKWQGLPGGATNVMLVSDTGDFSFPQVGDVGLVIQYSARCYYIGKLEYGYAAKLRGEVQDPDTEVTLRPKKVYDGNIFIGNILKRTWLNITTGGGFSLMNGFNDGLTYRLASRLLSLSGMVTRVIGNGVTMRIGSVMRDGVAKTDVIAQEVPLVPAIETCIELLFQQIKIARFHLGHIKSTVTDAGVGVDELSTSGGKLRAVLEVTAGPVTLAALKMDEPGNIELTSLAGKIMIDTNLLQGILLGGISAVHRALLGEPFLMHYKAHTHSTAMGPSGPIIAPVVDEVVLSQKVKLI